MARTVDLTRAPVSPTVPGVVPASMSDTAPRRNCEAGRDRCWGPTLGVEGHLDRLDDDAHIFGADLDPLQDHGGHEILEGSPIQSRVRHGPRPRDGRRVQPL